MLRKNISLLGFMFALSGCVELPGYNLSKNPDAFKPEMYMGDRVYIAPVYTDCLLYNRETRLTYFAKNIIKYIPQVKQFAVYDKTSPLGSPIFSPKMRISASDSYGGVRYEADEGNLYFEIINKLPTGETIEFTIANKTTNKFMTYSCTDRNVSNDKVVANSFISFSADTVVPQSGND